MLAKRINVLIYVVLLIGFQLFSSGLSAQEQAQIDTVAVDPPEPFTLIDLGLETERIREDVNLARSRMADDSRIVFIDSIFLLFTETLDKEKEEYVIFRRVTPNRQKLDNMIFKWSGYSDRLSGW